MWDVFKGALCASLAAGVAGVGAFALWRGHAVLADWPSLIAAGVTCALTCGVGVFVVLFRQRNHCRDIGLQIENLLKTEDERESSEFKTLAKDHRWSLLLRPLHKLMRGYTKLGKHSHEQKLRQQTFELSRANQQLRRINRDLERLKESYRDLYHEAPAMYFSLDPNGCIVTLNDTLLRTLGYRRNELLQQPYMNLLPFKVGSSWEFEIGTGKKKEPLSELLTREGEVEAQWQKKDGTVIDVLIRTVPVQDEQGRFVRSRSAAQDMTERNRLENELRNRRDELESTNAKLLHINRELEEFTSVVSHDLKEPLRTLQAYSTLLLEDFSAALGTDGFEYINNLVLASRRMEKLIEDLLHLSWAGRIKRNLEVFNLAQTVAVVRRDLGHLIQRKKANIYVDGSLPQVTGDPVRIAQLLANLVGNALKYNENVKPTVHIGQLTREQCDSLHKSIPADHAVVYVRDNGIGMDPKNQPKIFEMFRRLHRADEYEGTGAGLAICKKIIEAHAGDIWVESAIGNGATFYFTLPTDLKPANRKSRSRSQTPAVERDQKADLDDNRRRTTTTAPRRLLLVEDMKEIGAIALKLSERAGHDVQWVQTGELAWDQLQSRVPDLILLDVHLPGMSGLDLCKKIRSEPQFAETPIALFTQDSHIDGDFDSYGILKVLSKKLLSEPSAWQNELNEILEKEYAHSG